MRITRYRGIFEKLQDFPDAKIKKDFDLEFGHSKAPIEFSQVIKLDYQNFAFS